jgi:hypothetical protein
VRGQMTSQTEQSSRPMSRAMSIAYWRWGSAGTPPLPKQPQLISRPRAHADEIQMMNARKNRLLTMPMARVNRPRISREPITISMVGSA